MLSAWSSGCSLSRAAMVSPESIPRCAITASVYSIFLVLGEHVHYGAIMAVLSYNPQHM